MTGVGGPPSPSESLSESLSDGLSQLMKGRRRVAWASESESGAGASAGVSAGPGQLPYTHVLTQSQMQMQTGRQPTPTASSTLATFASNWVVPFGRRKKAESMTVASPAVTEARNINGRAYHESDASRNKDVSSASEMLKRL